MWRDAVQDRYNHIPETIVDLEGRPRHMPPLERSETSQTFIKDEYEPVTPDEIPPNFSENRAQSEFFDLNSQKPNEKNSKEKDFELKFDTSVKLMKEKCRKYEEHLAKRYIYY